MAAFAEPEQAVQAVSSDVEENETTVEQSQEEPTEQQMLEATKNFLPKDVSRFGIYLGVSYATIKAICSEKPNGCSLQALQIYNCWRKTRGPRLSWKDRKRLSEAFDHCGHRRDEFCLRSTMPRPKTLAGLHEFDVYIKLVNIDFDDRKLQKFGENLGLPSTTVRDILIENMEETKPVIALAIFTTWKSNISIKDDDIACETLDNAIKDITQYESVRQHRTGTTPTPTPEFIASFSARPLSSTVLPSPNGGHQDDVTQPLLRSGTRTRSSTRSSNCRCEAIPNPNDPDPTEPRPNKNRKFAGYISCTFCIFTATIIEVALLVLALSYKQEEMINIFPGDTILLPLPSAYTPSSLDLVLFGQESTCYAEALVVKCSNIGINETKVLNLSGIDYNYFAPGSSVTISGNNLIRPYQIWLFSNKVDADSAVNEEFHSYDCSYADKQDGVYCAQLNAGQASITINITKPSYYFIRCDQEPFDCSQVDQWLINAVTYDFDIAHDHIIHRSKVRAQNISSSKLKIRPSVFYSKDSVSDLCPITQLSTNTCGSHDTIYRINTTSTSLAYELLIYTTIIIIVILLTLLSLVVCIRCCCKNRQIEGNRERTINASYTT